MAALTESVPLQFKGTMVKDHFPCDQAGTFYQGAILYLDDSANKFTVANQAAAQAGDRPVGIVASEQVTTAADDLVEAYVAGVIFLPYTSPAVGDGGYLYIANGDFTDNPNTLIDRSGEPAAATDAKVGQIIRSTTAGAWVLLDFKKCADASTGVLVWY